MPEGYISGTVGKNTADAVRVTESTGDTELETDSLSADRSSRSRGRVRGYVARSSWGANWAGLTKIDNTVRSFSASDLLTLRGQVAMSEVKNVKLTER